MMRIIVVLWLMYLILPLKASGQNQETKLKGKIVDASTQAAIPYASFGVMGQDVGTVSNSEGMFELTVRGVQAKDSLALTMIGFEKQVYQIAALAQQLLSNPELQLRPAMINLEQVEITEKKIKTSVLGNEASTAGVGMTPFKYSRLGNEIGLLCKVNGKTTYLEQFGVTIFINDFDTLFFRLNIYTLEDGVPKENILTKPIYLQFTGAKGKATIDLSSYNIVVDTDFVVSLEYVKELRKINFDRNEQSGLYFGAKKVFGGTVYTRHSSQGQWLVSGNGLFAPKMEVIVKN